MHSRSKEEVLRLLSVNGDYGLVAEEIAPRRVKWGGNVISRAKQKTLIMRVLEAFCEPMLLILCFALAITLGVNVGKFIRTGEGDFVECIGIFVAVTLSVTITVVMENRSEKAFELLSSLSDKALVRVKREGEIKLVPQSEAVVGDIILLAGGDRVVADGRLIKSDDLSVDESTLTGESKPRKKRADAVVGEKVPLAERVNMVYGGTLVSGGSGEMVVTAVGNDAEIGRIAGELQMKNRISPPLNEKLSRLGKGVTLLGGISAAIVFVVSLLRLIAAGKADFLSVQEIFIESVVLIVAAVPEGLPTIVAISLSINALKLARENALIKRLVVAETAGCVSVICSDKTGTLTCNRMEVTDLCSGKYFSPGRLPDIVRDNIIANTAAEVVSARGKHEWSGSPTECALLRLVYPSPTEKLGADRAAFMVTDREEFTSEKKYSSAKTHKNGHFCIFYKGAFEKISAMCDFDKGQYAAAKNRADYYASNAKRVIAFAHGDGEHTVFDGFAAIADPVRKDVKRSVEQCKRAGIAVKILTGDNAETAFAVAKELGIAHSRDQVLNAPDAEKMSDAALTNILGRVTVVARSTPLMKLRAVNLLKSAGEVVAVTGDGINDAPAIKQADIGIAMGSGSEIAKEAGDIILLDDSFSTIVKAISFGRNVFANFRRFIMFQLSVNFSAVAVVLACLFAGLKSPFNALQLLWLNIIMDGPPALTLGFEAEGGELMNEPPKKRSDNLVNRKTGARILLHSLYMAALIVGQLLFNFLDVPVKEGPTAIFTAFVLMQLFNAFNCRQVGTRSIFKGFFSNKPMLVAFGVVTAFQVAITQLGGAVFGTVPLSFVTWLKITALSSTVLAVSEISKAVYGKYLKTTGKTPSAKFSAAALKR